MKRILAIVVVFLHVAAPVSASPVSNLFSSFYSFGDSYTDDGKFGLASSGGLLDAPSFGGRFSNGLTWSEIIEDEFSADGKDSRNYALGGATASPTSIRNPAGPLGTLEKQIAAFTAELLAPIVPPLRDPGSNPLFSLWFGGNDAFEGQSTTAAADFVADGVRALAALGQIVGSTFNNFLIFDLLDIPGDPGASAAFNTRMDANVAALRSEGINIFRFDPSLTLNTIINDTLFNGAQEFGITELLQPCAVSFLDGDPASCLDDGRDPNTFLLADTVHPTAPVHALLARQVSASIVADSAIAPVPLPAGGALLLTALGAFALVQRRRKVA